MGTTNIILGIGFATLSALTVTLIVQVRALHRALAYLGDAQIKSRDEVVFRGIDALRGALGQLEEAEWPARVREDAPQRATGARREGGLDDGHDAAGDEDDEGEPSDAPAQKK